MAGEILTQLNRIDNNIDAAFEKCRALGATMPSTINSDYLADTIETIPSAADIPVKTSDDMTASGATVTAPAGWYKQAASKSVPTATQATPSIEVNSSGLITAKTTQSAGYVAAGTKSGTKQLTTQAAKTVTPTKSEQTVVAAGRYTTGAVKVAKIPDSYIQPTGTKAITENGTHDVKAYASVEVNVAGSGGGGGAVETCTVKINNQCVSRGTRIIKLIYLTLANGELVQEYSDSLSLSESEIEIENVVCGTYMYVEISRSYSFTYVGTVNSGKYLLDGVYFTEFYTPYEANSVCTVTVHDDD